MINYLLYYILKMVLLIKNPIFPGIIPFKFCSKIKAEVKQAQIKCGQQKGGETMRKWLVGLILVALLVTFSVSIYAKHDKFGDGPRKYYGESDRYQEQHNDRYQERKDARFIIHRTANTIFAAQQAAARGRNYFGLRRAIAHQQRARDLYVRGYYRDAIFHSLRARDLAFQVISENREKPSREYCYDPMENRYVQSAPRNNELDISIDTVKVGKDDALVRLHFGLDIN
jgi:hypothetical protein